jgi:hypothetical protein
MKTLREKLWKLFLRTAREITLTMDDWIQRQEVSLREGAAVAQFQAEVDPVASAAREKSYRIVHDGVTTGGKTTPLEILHARSGKPRVARLARLKYQHGEFVRN